MISFLLAQADGAPPAATKPLVEAAKYTLGAQNWLQFFLILGISVGIAFVLYIIAVPILRGAFRKFESDVALVILNVSSGPVAINIILIGLKIGIGSLGSGGAIGWIDRIATAILIGGVTYWIAQLSTKVVIYYLKELARKTEAVWDDVLLPILDKAFPIVTYLIGGSLLLETLGIDLSGLGLALGSLTVVIGLAIKDILSDFFGGLVLLVDTPFQFGDVISVGGEPAVIKSIGVRVTKLYMINSHTEVYTPNSAFGGQSITNTSRPTPHYAYSIDIGVRVDADPMKATDILMEIVMGHPDTLGELDEKLVCLDKFYGLSEAQGDKLAKKDAGRLRLLAEKEVDAVLQQIEQGFDDLSEKLKGLERGGLDKAELISVQQTYLDIARLVGLKPVKEPGKRSKSRLEEPPEGDLPESLMALVRVWYQAWLKDPDLVPEDRRTLGDEWEQKLGLLELKMNKLYQKFANPGGEETRLDDYAKDFIGWLHEYFKESKITWKEPKVRLTDITGGGMQFTVRFYVDNIKLEHWERGYRVNNEVRREMIRRLRLAYIYNA